LEYRVEVLYVLLPFLIFNDFFRPIFSKSAGPIFVIFAGLMELWVKMIILKLVFDPLRGIAVAINFCWPSPLN